MEKLKLHTAVGVNDILPSECAKKRTIEAIIKETFVSQGYSEVEVPTFEYYDCYVGEKGSFSQDKMFRFFDEKGNLLSLRPDFTNSIARMSATKMNSTLPQRYMYNGNVYRLERDHDATARELTQCGIELIGSYSPKADAEVIAATIRAVLETGITELSVEVGQVAFFNGLAEQAQLSEKEAAVLRDRIDSKDCVGIKEITDKLDISESIKNLLIELPYMFGGKDVIEKARVEGLNDISRVALDNLEAIIDCLENYGFEKYLSIDLGMLQSIDYYTGSIFKGYTTGIGFPIFGGGRYDKMMENFGAPKGAVGAAITVNRLMSVLSEIYNIEEESAVVFSEKGAEKRAYELAEDLRKLVYTSVEYYIGGYDFAEAIEFAKERYSQNPNCTKLICVRADESIMVYDVVTDEETELDLENMETGDNEE